MSHHKRQEHHIRAYKILAQTFGLLVCGFYLLFIIREGMPDTGEGNELIPFLPLILLPVAGYIVTWIKEWPGAVIMIAGGIILLTYFLFNGDISIAFIYSIPFIVAGSLFLLHIKKRRELQHKK